MKKKNQNPNRSRDAENSRRDCCLPMSFLYKQRIEQDEEKEKKLLYHLQAISIELMTCIISLTAETSLPDALR